MSAKILTDLSDSTHPNSTVSARVWDLVVDNNITGANIPSVTPGAINTFLHTNAASEIVWEPFQADNITGGNDNDILTKDPVLGWTATDKIINSNLPDDVVVNSVEAADVTCNNSLIDSAGSPGNSGEILQKNGLNNLVWSPLFGGLSINTRSSNVDYAIGGATTVITFNVADFQNNSDLVFDVPTNRFDSTNGGSYYCLFSGYILVNEAAENTYNLYFYRDNGLATILKTLIVSGAGLNRYLNISTSFLIDNLDPSGQLYLGIQRASGTGVSNIVSGYQVTYIKVN